MNVPVPPLPAMLPVSNLWVCLSVSVCATESLFVTVTFCPGFTVMVPENANPLITMPAVAPGEDPAAGGAVALLEPAVLFDAVEVDPPFEPEPQEASTRARAATPLASA